jgi:hypothetical protein
LEEMRCIWAFNKKKPTEYTVGKDHFTRSKERNRGQE